jgi:hypothetical protein
MPDWNIQKIEWKRDTLRLPWNRRPNFLKIEFHKTFPFKESSTIDEFKKQGKLVKSESFQRFDDRGYCFITFSVHSSDFDRRHGGFDDHARFRLRMVGHISALHSNSEIYIELNP